jgi:hypothetical protein
MLFFALGLCCSSLTSGLAESSGPCPRRHGHFREHLWVKLHVKLLPLGDWMIEQKSS